MDIDWVHPGDHCNLETSSHPWEARLLWKFDSKTEMCGFCNCVAACWEGFHRCTDALENQIWTWRMFFGDGKWVLMTCLYFADGSSTEPFFFFVKKQYPPFAIFFNNYKMVAQKLSIPMTYTPPVPWSLNCLPAWM